MRIQLSTAGDVNETVLTNYLAKNLNDEWSIVIAEAVSDCVSDFDGAYFFLYKRKK
jgi:hypothetical protein